MTSTPLRRAAPLLVAGIGALVVGGSGGLARIGVLLPTAPAQAVAQHGPLLVLGFLGTLISLERAVALGGRWPLAAPALSAAGVVVLVGGLPVWVAAALSVAGMAGLAAIFVAILRLRPSLASAVLVASGVCALAGAVAWLLAPSMRTLTPPLAGFVVLAIAGERLEMARIGGAGKRATPFAVAVTATAAAGIVLAVAPLTAVAWVLGAGLLGTTAWLLRHEIAWRTVHRAGLPRFSAIGLLCGYVSLALAGLVIVVDGDVALGRYADIAIHGVFVGFAMSMVMVHAPIIVPSVTRLPLQFRRHAYGPLVLLQLSLLARYAGDVAGSHALIVAGGVGNAVALTCFVVLTAVTVVRSARIGRRAGGQTVPVPTPSSTRLASNSSMH